MAGLLVNAVPKRVVDFSSFFTGFNSQYTLLERIDISQYVDCMVGLRIHAINIASGSVINFDVYGDGYTDDDPGLIFRSGSPLFTSPAIGAGFPAPAFFTYGGTVHGHYLSVVANAGKFVAGACSATISIDLALRSPDDS